MKNKTFNIYKYFTKMKYYIRAVQRAAAHYLILDIFRTGMIFAK